MSDSPPPSFALKIPEEPKRKYLTAVLQAAPAGHSSGSTDGGPASHNPAAPTGTTGPARQL